MEQHAYSIDVFCYRYSISRRSFYRHLNAGYIHAVKCGRRTLISHTAAEQWFSELPSYQLKRKKFRLSSLTRWR